MDFTELLKSGRDENGKIATRLPDSWTQGRTAYGGLTAALCAEAAARTFQDLPPMRSLQVAFVGPASGDVRTDVRMLRQGKNTAFVEADLQGEKGTATRGVFVYGARRDSSVTMENLPLQALAPRDDVPVTEFTEGFPTFLKQFEYHIAVGGMPFYGKGESCSFWYARHRDPSVWGTELGLIALADLTPPAVAPTISGPAPVSSVTWQMDLLTDDLSTDDGWYILMTDAQAARDGWSGQNMAVWSLDGRPIAGGRQSIVVFA